MNKSIYFPDNAKTREVLKRVGVVMKNREKAYGRKPSFGEMCLEGLKKLVTVKKK